MRDPTSNDSVAGLIERVTFFNEESGFAVLRVKAKGFRELVTVVGSVPAVSAGEWLVAEGEWQRDREHGLQLRARLLRCTPPPTTREGIEKYLGSGMVKGIGPIYAKKLIEKFGDKIFEIIDSASARLEEVDGIGPGRRKRIKEAWGEQKLIREIMVFLHSHGVSTSRAVRIYKRYGENAIETIRANPYLLAQEIHGIGFLSADRIAQRIGIPADSMLRIEAGLRHLLQEAVWDGHCALPISLLLTQASELMRVSSELVEQALGRLTAAGEAVREEIEDEALVFSAELRDAEIRIAARVAELASGPPRFGGWDTDKALAWCETKTEKKLGPSQRAALVGALQQRVFIVTGGPGVGKTTLLQSLLRIVRAKQVRTVLCAPTGRAAKRLSEATGLPAGTIHRLLEFQPGRGFTRHEGRPLEADLVVVDEVSMVDVVLFDALLRAHPPGASLLLVGDVDQLPSVGPGTLLRDLIASGAVPVARLTEIFRQAQQSRIVTAAHAVNEGHWPELPGRDVESDFYFVERDTPEAIMQSLVEFAVQRIPEKFRLDPFGDIQVLAPMNKGSLGVRELNAQLQNRLNPARAEEPVAERFGWQYRVRDKVIQLQNNYDKVVFNGDIGQVRKIDPVEQQLIVSFDGNEVAYEFSELDELGPAYAITVHKSQGSEFPVVLIPVAMQHAVLLQRNLLYTGMTRGRKLVVLVGQKKAFGFAIHNDRTTRRYSGLQHRLSSIVKASPD